MHELALAQTIVAIALEAAQGARVSRVTLEIGQLSAVLPDAIQFCFEVCCQGTPLEGATLEIIDIPGLGRCRRCGAEVPLEQPFGLCECGSVDLDIVQGNELTVKALETDDLCV